MTAAIDEQHLTSPGSALGTVAYMSPEQARARELDARSDLFSFGAVLYEMATGMLPFRGESSAVIFKAILEQHADIRGAAESDVPAELERIINRALEKDRNLRYQHASEMRAEMQRLKRDSDSGRVAAASSAKVEAETGADFPEFFARIRSGLCFHCRLTFQVHHFRLRRSGATVASSQNAVEDYGLALARGWWPYRLLVVCTIARYTRPGSARKTRWCSPISPIPQATRYSTKL